MKVSALVCLVDSVEPRLAKREKYSMRARERKLREDVDILRTIVPSAVFTLFASGLAAGMVGREEDVRALEEYFTIHPGRGYIIRDRPDAIRPAR